MKNLYALFLFTFYSISLFSQNTETAPCGNDEYRQVQLMSDPDYAEQLVEFEVFYQEYVNSPVRSSAGVDTLPVVVHIIHDGHAIGSAENPADAEIVQKIIGVNERFRHVNQVDGPNPFSNADTEISLCLAEKDPAGNYTTGIIRHDDSLTYNTPSELVAAIENYKWDTDKYLNIFELEYISGAIGRYYGGSIDVVTVRTGTSSWLLAHEVGHYFSLRHTFHGACTNGDCLTNGDLVCDTPPKGFSGMSGSCGSPGNSCTTDEDDTSANNPYRSTALGGMGDQVDVLQNYMDYTEGCGGSFTEGQKNRMKANILAERQTNIAHTAVACNFGYAPITDAAVSEILFADTVCNNMFLPSVKIKNHGTALLTSANIEYYLSGSLVHTEPWSGNLATGEEEWVDLAAALTVPEGRYKLLVKTVSPNGVADEFANNDGMSRYVAYYENGFQLPYSEDMMEFVFPEHWQVSGNLMKWYMHGYSGLDGCQSDDRPLAYNGNNEPGSAAIELPPLDVSGHSVFEISFDLGYIPYSATYPDTLKIEALPSCGPPVLLWEINGFGMATNDPPAYGNTYSYPTCDDMDHVSFSVPGFGCQSQLSIRITMSGWGRTPLIMDNITITETAPCVPEGCTFLTSPNMGEMNVLPDADMTWNPVDGVDGYFVDIGYADGGAELLNHFNVVGAESFNPPVLLPCDTNIFITISPYVGGVEEMGCLSQKFSTFSLPACLPTFSQATAEANFDAAMAAFAADMDGDGDMDILATAQNDGTGWWENDGSENFTAHILDASFRGSPSVEAVDIDDDGDMDILSASRLSSQVAWWQNDGSGNFTKHLIDAVFGGAQNARAADMDNDGDIDVVAVSRSSSEINWYENDGSENFTKHFIDASLTSSKSIYVADMNGDNKIDIVGAGEVADEVAWYENNGGGNFTKHTVDNSLDGAMHVHAADVNEDSYMDIVASGVVADQFVWYENDGSQIFMKHIIETNVNGATGVYVEDIDNDGDWDIFGSSPSSVNLAWYENDGDENFTRTVLLSSYSYVVSFFPVDLNGNGTMDILTPFYGADEIGWLESSCDPVITTHLISPAIGAIGISKTSPIEWYAHPGAAGYHLAIGTSLGGEDILAFQDVGNVSTFDPPGDLPLGTEIFVTIIPYDGLMQMKSCAEGSFTTEGCTPNLVITDDPIPAGSYFGEGELLTQNASVSATTSVIFHSDTAVRLEPEFTVEDGAVFEIVIQACPD